MQPAADQNVKISPHLRLFFPSAWSNGQWLAYTLRNRRLVHLSSAHAIVLILAVNALPYEKFILFLGEEIDLDIFSARVLVSDLHEAHLIEIGSDNNSGVIARKLIRMQREWRRVGWRQSFEYFLFTYDFPYNPGNVAGRARAAEIMREYSKVEPDINRVRHFCPDLELQITNVQSTACKISTERPKGLCSDDLVQILWNAAAGKRRKRPEWGGSDLIFRPAPSGGSRHPIDTYIFVCAVEGMEPGIYYFDFQRNVVCRIGEGLMSGDIRDTFPGLTSRCESNPKAVVAWTAVPERNMYRYREPRTYRTLFLDAGHLIENFHISASKLGRPFHIHYFANVQNFMTRISSSVDHSIFLAAMAIA